MLALACLGMQYAVTSQWEGTPVASTYFGMHALGGIVSFAVVFRTNLGWQRYWEAITQLHFLYSKWTDAYSQIVAFAMSTVETATPKAEKDKDAAAKLSRVQASMRTLEGHFVLMSVLAVDRLAHGDTRRMEKRSEMASWSKQITRRIELRKEDLTGARKLPTFYLDGDEGAVEQASENAWDGAYRVRSMPSTHESKVLEASTDRVSVTMYWILHSLAIISKDLDIAPPIQSRMYQELSNGMLGFNQSMKIADVPFPFMYAQLLTLLLTVWSLFLPLYVCLFTQSMIIGPVMTFLLFEGFWGVNEVAKELENPFGVDANDICLPDFHSRFMDTMLEIKSAFVARINTVADMQSHAPQRRTSLLEAAANAGAPCDVFNEVTEPLASLAVTSVPKPLDNTVVPINFDDIKTCPVVPREHEPWNKKATFPVTKSVKADVKASLPPVASEQLLKTTETFNERLVQIGERIVQHLEHVAKELEVGSRMEEHLHFMAKQLAPISVVKESTSSECMTISRTRHPEIEANLTHKLQQAGIGYVGNTTISSCSEILCSNSKVLSGMTTVTI
eukprot:TRINITY_DN24914_c0_g1_i1.p1 TRINITY_DN24914_c0_g1~~TRINITY_DN24914_c0_g1_i1.p1  ORF type:complete len:617 (-),score=76.74 TRINITY_DN24914_c0_g1_i1:26-1711(-)